VRVSVRYILIGIALLAGTGRGAGQEVPVRPEVESGLPPPERRGSPSSSSSSSPSPLETLESLVGAGNGEADEIETDRDSFTPATTVTPRGRFIFETAYSFVDNRGVKETHSFPEFLVRYGLTERIELRLGWNAEVGGAGSSVSGSTGGQPFREADATEREYTISYGAKFRLNDQRRLLPRGIVIVQAGTPTGGSEGIAPATALVATYAAGWELPRRLRFDAAIRYGLDSEHGDRFSQWAPSAVLRVPIGEKLAAHAEYFGIMTSGKEVNRTVHFISPGVHYLVTPELEIGVRLGWGLNDQSARFFANTGLGWRF
jgi:Putative MetA-pathway of phenol degradation